MALAVIHLAKNALSMAASVAASVMVARSVLYQFLPQQAREYIETHITKLLSFLFPPSSKSLIVVIDEAVDGFSNEVYEAVAAHLSGKISSSTMRISASKRKSDDRMIVSADRGEQVTEEFEGVRYSWRLSTRKDPTHPHRNELPEMRFFELSFHRRYQKRSLETYLAQVVQQGKDIQHREKKLRLSYLRHGNGFKVTFNHPAKFDTVAMDPELKEAVMEDLRRFLSQKDYYTRVGKAWKRGYLLYGPPGTGKSSLIAAIANFLKFNVYVLELTGVPDNTTLLTQLIKIPARSILVVEDIDCSVQLRSRTTDGGDHQSAEAEAGVKKSDVTLSGVLNVLDGLMSCCMDERIIIFTTNHRESLDEALLRPGRMDMHINMSYCTPAMFRILANNYHGIDDHYIFPEIERLIQSDVNITPAEVTGELMASEEPDQALGSLLRFIRQKAKDPKRKKTPVSEIEEIK